ncbi:MAG: L,D-transpeptidase family protein [Solirubrobacteraceae bacterium]
MFRRPLLTAVATAACIGPLPAPAEATGPGCDRSTAILQARLTELRYRSGSLDGCSGPATRAAVQAFQKAQGLTADGDAGPLTRRALRSPTRPSAQSSAPGRHAEIDLRRQLLLVVRDGEVRRIYAATTGMAGYRTPTGSYRISRKEPRSWSGEYDVWLPWASYFDSARGLAIHAGDVRSQPASHGCVRVPAVFAEEIYRLLPPSTKIIVR